MIYEHISNISPDRSTSIRKATNKKGWDQKPLDKNKMMTSEAGISESWEITKKDGGGFHDLILDDHMILYRYHPETKQEEAKYRRMVQWENKVRIREMQEEPIDDILSLVDRISVETRDQKYLCHKLLRETNNEDRKEAIKSYIDQI